MTPRLSVYFNALRFLAAFWVVLAHFRAWGFAPPTLAEWLPTSGRDAVVLFFVLSGYVIAFTAERKDGRTYLIDRVARIYSVVVPVLLVATMMALWGKATGVAGYDGYYQADQIFAYMGLYLTFLGSSWFLQEVPFGIVPYWSLNFEVWYYVLFGALMFLRGWVRVAVFGTALLVVGFKLWLLWPVWLAGVWLYRNAARWPLRPTVARALLLASVVLYGVIEIGDIDQWMWAVSNAPFGGAAASALGDARFFLSDYATGLLTVAHLYAFRYANLGLPRWSAPAINWAAGATFTLYLAHGPLLTFFNIHVGRGDGTVGTALLLLAALLAAVFMIAYGTERRLNAWKRGVHWTLTLAERCASPLRRRVAFKALLRLHR